MKLTTALPLLASLILLGSPARAGDYRTARVSDVRGNMTLRGQNEDTVSYAELNTVVREGDTLWTDDSARAELELEQGAWVRLAEDTKVDVRRLLPSPQLRLWSGSLYLDVSDRVESPIRVETPVGDLDVEANSVVRVDLNKSESARVSILSGRAELFPDRGNSLRAGGGERVYLEADRAPDAPRGFDREDRDAFDLYQKDRVDYYISRPLPRELDRDIVGSRDLADYGSWVVVDRVSYWRPRCEPDWRPYSDGYWSYVPGCGYTWIDYAPWGYTTCHYGRWLYRPVHGWLWCPGYSWSPAWVYWGSCNDYYCWAPLDPWGAPCYYGPGNFCTSFGLIIDFRSWSGCDRNSFFFGRHHRNFNHAGGPLLLTGSRLGLRVGGFHAVRDVNSEFGIPRDPVRGLTINNRGELARDRVLHFERGMDPVRLRLAENRFGAPVRDQIDRLRTGSTAERLQTAPTSRIEPDRILTGNEAVQRLHRGVPSENRGGDTDARRGGAGARPGADEGGRSGRDGLKVGRDRGEGNRGRGDGTREGGRNAGPGAGARTDPPSRGEPGDRLHGGSRGESGRTVDPDSPFRRGVPTRGRGEEPGQPAAGRGGASSGRERGIDLPTRLGDDPFRRQGRPNGSRIDPPPPPPPPKPKSEGAGSSGGPDRSRSDSGRFNRQEGGGHSNDGGRSRPDAGGKKRSDNDTPFFRDFPSTNPGRTKVSGGSRDIPGGSPNREDNPFRRGSASAERPSYRDIPSGASRGAETRSDHGFLRSPERDSTPGYRDIDPGPRSYPSYRGSDGGRTYGSPYSGGSSYPSRTYGGSPDRSYSRGAPDTGSRYGGSAGRNSGRESSGGSTYRGGSDGGRSYGGSDHGRSYGGGGFGGRSNGGRRR